MDEVATCRGCRRILNGKPYYMGGAAYHPETKERCPSNWYGGFVCSRQCDVRASEELEFSMPGCRWYPGAQLSSCAAESIRRNWDEQD